MRAEYVCRSVRRNNGIRQVLLVRDDTTSQPLHAWIEAPDDEFAVWQRVLMQTTIMVGKKD